MATKKGKGKESVKPSKSQKKIEQPKAQAATGTSAKIDTDLIKFWTNLQEDLGKQITQIMERQQKFYEDFNGKWTKVSTEMSDTVSKATMNNEQLEGIQQVWERHSQKMNQRLESIMKSESETFENLNGKWKSMSEDMSKAVMSLGNVNDMRKSQERFLMTWTEMSQEMTRQMARSIEMGNGEFKVLRDTWTELVEDMDSKARDITERDPSLVETMKTWNDNSRELNKNLMDHMDNSAEDVSKLQTMWTRSLSSVTSEFVKSVWDANMKWYEENANKLPRSK